MMFRVLLFVIIALFTAFAASWLSRQDGSTVITWLGYQAEISSSLLVVIIVGFCLSVVMVDRFVRALFRWPSYVSAGWQARRRRKGELALSLGFVALAAGDNRAATKQARRAEKLLDKGILTDLLVAQSSYASGDHKAAGRYFKKLAKEETTAYFGQLGLMRLHQQEQSDDVSQLAYQAAQKAFVLDPTSVEAAQIILRKALQERDWEKAMECLKLYLNQSGGQSEAEITRAEDLYARLSLQMAYDTDDQKQAILLCEQALKLRGDFVPAAERLVLLLVEKGDKRGAQKQAASAFHKWPQLRSLALMRQTRRDNDGQFISHMMKIAPSTARPDDAYLAVAQFAISVGIWASASQALSHISEGYIRHNHYYLVEAEIAKGLEDSEGHHHALQLAADAPRAGLWQCHHCKTTMAHYEFDCSACGAPGQIIWQW